MTPVSQEAKCAYALIAPPGSEKEIMGGRRGAAVLGIVMSMCGMAIAVWLCVYTVQTLLEGPNIFITIGGWVALIVTFLMFLFFAGLLAIVVLSGELRTRPDQKATDA